MIPDRWRLELDPKVELKGALFGDGANGSALQIFANDELGITRMLVVPAREQAAIVTWYAEKFPHREFKTLNELRTAWNADVPIRRCPGWQVARGAGQPCSRCTRFCGGDLIGAGEVTIAPPEFLSGECPARIPLAPGDVEP